MDKLVNSTELLASANMNIFLRLRFIQNVADTLKSLNFFGSVGGKYPPGIH